MLKEKAKPCSELSEKVLNEMCSDGYPIKSVEHHVRPIYNRLAEYCEEHFEGMYSVDAGKAFMQMIQRKKQSKEQTDLNRNTVERLDHMLDGDFYWRPAKSKLRPYASSCYDADVARYEAYLIQTGKTITSTRYYIHLIAGFLAYMESIGISSLPMIKAEHYRNGLSEEEPPNTEKVTEFEERYQAILQKAKAEYEYILASEYYEDGYNLYLRMEEYMSNHLLFLHDYRVPATNNESEWLLRRYKRKKQQAVSFRGFESIEYLCECMSMLIQIR